MIPVGLPPAAVAPPVAPHGRFTDPWQPWASADGRVRLLRPAVAGPTTSDAPLGALTAPGWRLVWNGAPPTPGRMLLRLSLPVSPPSPQRTATQTLQVGVSRAPADVRTCLTYGLKAGSGRRRADRVIGGRRYAVWTHADAGMSQQVSATDLRAVVGGACYAVARVAYGVTASERDPAVTLTLAQGAALLDRALQTLRIGARPLAQRPQPPRLHPPAGAVAR